MVAQITTFYKHGVQKRISELTKCRTLSNNGRRPHARKEILGYNGPGDTENLPCPPILISKFWSYTELNVNRIEIFWPISSLTSGVLHLDLIRYTACFSGSSVSLEFTAVQLILKCRQFMLRRILSRQLRLFSASHIMHTHTAHSVQSGANGQVLSRHLVCLA